MEYIKKVDLLNKAVEVEYLNRPRLMVSVATIGQMPSIDIVRCKDCRHFSVVSDEEEGTNYYRCGVWSNATDEDAFCSYGAKMKGADDE